MRQKFIVVAACILLAFAPPAFAGNGNGNGNGNSGSNSAGGGNGSNSADSGSTGTSGNSGNSTGCNNSGNAHACNGGGGGNGGGGNSGGAGGGGAAGGGGSSASSGSGGPNGMVLMMVQSPTASSADMTVPGQQVMSPAQAAKLDRKMDDGNPTTGRIHAYGKSDTCFGADGHTYDETSSSKDCGLFFTITR